MSLFVRLFTSLLLLLVQISSRSSSSHSSSSSSSSSTPSLSLSPSSSSSASASLHDLKVFHANTSELQRLVFDKGSERFLLAGTNGLFSLDLNFDLLQQVSTGPVLDDKRCTREFGLPSCSDNSNSYETKLTDNHNKILLVDTTNEQLIACGSVFQGSCQTRLLSDLSETTFDYNLDDPEYFLATNEEKSPTVAFVAPGISDEATLYVAASRPDVFPPRDIPAVSSRILTGVNKFRLSHSGGLDGGSFVKFIQDVPEWFKVSYVDGFSHDGFSYFVTNQIIYTPELEVRKETLEVSKIIQVCQKDRNYFSYLEIPIRCRKGSVEFELITSVLVLANPGKEVKDNLRSGSSEAILVASFSNRARNGSALTLFLMSDLRKVLTENLKQCFSGKQKYQGLQFGVKQCRSLDTEIGEDYCGEAEHNGPLVGTTAIEGGFSIQWTGLEITAMSYTVIQEHTVLFLATSTGHIKKVLVRRVGLLIEYEDIEVNQGHPLFNIIIITTANNENNGNKTTAVFLSQNKVYRLSTSECWNHSTCEECRGAKDPHCGWCSLENKCSLKSECMDSEAENRWLSSNSWECIHIPRQFVNPVHISVRKMEQITIGVKVLPIVTPPHSFVCIFSDTSASSSSSSSSSSQSLSSPAQVSLDEVRCTTPRNLNQFFTHPSVAGDQVNLTLSIESSQTKVKFLNTSLTLFDCSRFKSCLKCTRSRFNCLWCVTSHSCSQHDESTCPDEFFLRTPQACPQLEGRSSMDDVFIPVNVPTSLNIPALHLPSAKKAEFGYECLVHATTPPIRVPAKRVSQSMVICDSHSYSYDGNEPKKAVNIEVVYNKNFYIDDNNAMTVLLYKCHVMADDCSSCLNLEDASSRLSCVWCDGRCKNKHSCIHDNSVTCPNPVITEVSPSSGPTQGGTLVTIYGSNLGRRLSEVEGSITVANVLCDVINSEYVVSKKIVCKTRPVEFPRTGNVVVSIGNGASEWLGTFSYQNPQVQSIQPTRGPLSGGTLLTVRGSELNTGRSILVSLKDKDCSVQFVNDSVITCSTSKAEKAETMFEVSVKFDGARKRLESHLFTFTSDPTIENIFPLSAFASGGRMIQVFGMNFNSIQQPIMHLHHSSGNKSSPCIVHSDDVILCPVPPTSSSSSLSSSPSSSSSSSSSSSPSKRQASPVEYLISFSMDGVESVRDLRTNFPNIPSTLTIHPDPVFDPFEENRRVYKGEALMLTGTDLNLACEPSEVKITIGNETCRVNTLDSAALYCTPPHSQPRSVTGDANSFPEVKVVIGNLVYHLGYLEYQKAEAVNSDLWITGVAVGGGFLLTIIVVILIIYRHKSSRAHRQFRKLNMQLDVLESNIRNECKQAFAELQTEVSDFTSDLNAVGIPHWDYRTFISKVLIPYEDTSHFFLQTNGHHKVSLNVCDEGVVRFKTLLSQPQFIINFIQTLEQQKSFTIIDKVRVASLLSIIFHDRLDYLTRILKMLLGDLIKKTVSGNHPKLMLRRTESVVEKLLSNWLSMCLYEDLKGEVGRCLFMLFKAIKHQMFKGPVDCLTHEAKYSLSEDKLLREKIEAQTITVYVTRPPDLGESVPCKLLDCDTITQAKDKLLDAIYRNAPFSCRPSAGDLDLEWPLSHRGNMVLRDEDSSTVVIKGWKQMNTVGHYGVHDKAVLRLSPRMLTFKNSFEGFKEQSNGTLKHSLRIPILAKEDPYKQFHLVCQNTEVNPGNNQPKVMSEIYLTRLLATKFTLQQYVDDLFRSILRADTKQTRCIKWLFDFFDDSASSHDISDPQVVHTWKSNSLLLRFWVNILKNPEFVFDIHKPPIVDSCLSVITQTFMDSCSTHDQKLSKDSPSSKLLFAKDIPRYRKMVFEFYNEIRNLPRIPEDDLLNILALKSQQHACDLSGRDSLQQLYNYAAQYRIELLESLDDDPTARRLNLASQFETIHSFVQRDQIFC